MADEVDCEEEAEEEEDADETGKRCLPAWTRRSDVSGREVRSDRRVVRVVMGVFAGTVMGKASRHGQQMRAR